MRWYRGNIQIVFKHKDVLWNVRYGYIFTDSPFHTSLLNLFFIPILGFIVWGSAILSILQGFWLEVALIFLLFTTLQALTSILAIKTDNEDLSLT